MKQNFELRNEALSILKGNWGRVILLLFITIIGYIILYTIINNYALNNYCLNSSSNIEVMFKSVSVSCISFLSNIFILLPLTYLFLLKLLTFTRTKDSKYLTSNLFGTLKDNYTQSIAVLGLTTIYSLLWALLLLIPGIVKSYSYSLAKYIQMDNRDLRAEECIKKSMKLMKGKKMQLFLLDLSFILRWLAIPIITIVVFLALLFIFSGNINPSRELFGYALFIILAGILCAYLAVIYFVPYIETTRILFYEEVIKEQQIEE